MSDRPDNRSTQLRKPTKPLSDEPGFVDGIPVEELVRLTREFTARITNEDRRRLAMEVTEGGRSLQSGLPFVLQQFFTGKIDLDAELSKRFPSSPLVASAAFAPPIGKRARYGVAQYVAQDGSAAVTFEVLNTDLELSFLLSGMIAIRFSLAGLVEASRLRFLDLIQRANGITFLWTRERWERDYVVFVVRERFARIYAFSPTRFEAACRLTPDGLDELVAWLKGFWTGDGAAPEVKPEDQPSGTFSW
jgi:hypothetical protein